MAKILGNGHEIFENGLKLGYTTGSCATGAAYYAALMLMGEDGELVEFMTPEGIVLNLPIEDSYIEGEYAYAAIKKDAGDDPDITDGVVIYAKVKHRPDGLINIIGGKGIGTIRKKGLFGEVGEKAINPGPKNMIRNILQPMGGFDVEIFVPNGEELAKKTYNENIGIEGGISIIGTSGIVHPMSEKALIKTIELEINVIMEEDDGDTILLVPGNYGKSMKEKLKLDLPSVAVSNYVGQALKYAYEKGFRKFYLLGHIGKFSKLSIGIFNTHNSVADTRLEAFAYYMYKKMVPLEIFDELEKMTTAEEMMNFLIDKGYGYIIKDMELGAASRIKKYLKDKEIDVSVMIYSMERGRVL